MLRIGDVLHGTYRVERLLQAGGMAAVYVVAHTRLPKQFALKAMSPALRERTLCFAQFRREADILATLRHPHIVDIVDWNVSETGYPYLVMELLEGEDLATCLRRQSTLPTALALPICRQIGDALAHAHRAGVVHRDLKPSNIFLCQGPARAAKVLDFGIARWLDQDARLPASATVIGTPAYMAPEQAMGHRHAVDHRADQFALAVIAYEMLSGRPAFRRPGEPASATLTRVLNEELPPLPPYLRALEAPLQRALSKDPCRRFASIREFVAALDIAAARPIGDGRGWLGTGSPAEITWRLADRRSYRQAALAAALGVVCFALGLGTVATTRGCDAPPADAARQR